jgi:Cys-tRNA(Pro) deacylase
MAKKKIPVTPALRALNQAGAAYTPREYKYQDHGGTKVASQALGLDEHAVVKTLVMVDETGQALIVLMHGDREVSTKSLARTLGVKSIVPAEPREVTRLTGYQVGGTSPLGTRKRLPVYVEESILHLDLIAINGGRRGLLVEVAPRDLEPVLRWTPVQVALEA